VSCFDADTNQALGEVSREIAAGLLETLGVTALMDGRYVYGLRIKQEAVAEAEAGKDRPPTGKALSFQESVGDHKVWKLKELRRDLEPLYKMALVVGVKGSAVSAVDHSGQRKPTGKQLRDLNQEDAMYGLRASGDAVPQRPQA